MQHLGEFTGLLDHLAEYPLAVRDTRYVEQEGHAVGAHGFHGFGGKTRRFLVEQQIQHPPLVVATHETAFGVDRHAGRFGQCANLRAGEKLPFVDQIDADLNIDIGAEGIQLCRRIQHRLTLRHVDNGHQLIRQLIHRQMEKRQIVIRNRAAPIHQLQANAQTAVFAAPVVDDAFPFTRRLVEADPEHRLADAREVLALGFQEQTAQGRFDGFDTGNVINVRRKKMARLGDSHDPRHHCRYRFRCWRWCRHWRW